jgi:hypothetical protein
MKALLKLGCSVLALAFAVSIAADGSKAYAQSSSQPTPGRKAKTLFDDPDPTLALTPGNTRPRPAPPGSTPPNPDPKSFEGVWWLRGYEYLLGPAPGVPAPLKPQYIELLKKRIREKNAGHPETDTSTQCFPHGMPRLMESPYPIEIVQTPGRVTFLHEVAHEVRRIYLDQKHPANLKSTFLGNSVGHWEGDTLVVDTIGINDKSFIDDEGEAHSNQEHLVERYRKVDGGRQIELTMTVEDPVTLEHNYSYTRYYEWRPDVRPAEYICEENNRNAPVNGVTVAR